ncbi:YoaK family protein [Streptomyces mexicanus]|uniref:YoaK family protein n=1 Tax=Streptomyces mexicanus TaxID=178566 RepID=UPI0036BD08A5
MSTAQPPQRPWPGWTGATRYLLTLAAGATNAFGFLALGGVFTSVVTANSALLGLYLGNARLPAARLVAAALLGYVVGAAAGGLAAAGRGRVRGAGIRGGLLLEALLLWLVFFGWPAWHSGPRGRTLLLFLTAVAMGCQNGAVRVTVGGEVTTAYLTGLLTSTVTAYATRGRLAARNGAVVLALIAGAIAGGAAYRWSPAAAPLVPALLVSAALAATWARSPSHAERRPPLMH